MNLIVIILGLKFKGKLMRLSKNKNITKNFNITILTYEIYK